MRNIDTSLVDKAIQFATVAHKDVERRGKGYPYIIHPLEAMTIVATISNDPELLAAAVLHDVIEDTDITATDIESDFGERVAQLVQAESDVVFENMSEEDSWHMRKQISIDHLKSASKDIKIVAIGDKLSNMRTIASDYRKIGDELWNRFHVKDKAEHSWRYHGLLDALDELAGTEAYSEFSALINEVFGDK